MNGFILEPDQQDVFDKTREALRNHQAVLIQAATGFGKTVVGAFIVRAAYNKNSRVIMLMHRKELIEQTSKTFERASIPHSFISSAKKYNSSDMVHLASVGTLVNRLDKIQPPKLLLVDEGHHATAASWGKCINWAKKNGAKIVSLSATPWRLNGEGLKEYFDYMVQGPSVPWLIANGRLGKYKAYVPFIPDMSGVRHQAGDFVTAEVEEIMMDKSIVRGIVEQWQNKAYGKRTIGFARSVKHSESIIAQFLAAGISAVHIDADTPPAHRKQYLINFANGHTKVIFNCGLFGEGFDPSALIGRDVPIECVILANPTESLAAHLQCLGRGMRPKPDPAIFLDHCGSILKHGLPDSEYEWSLEAREKKKRGQKNNDEPIVRIKQCPMCYYACASALKECPECHHVFVIASRKTEEVDGDLREIKIDDMKKQARQEQGRAQSLDELIAIGKQRSMKNPQAWARYVFNARLAKKKM